LEKKCRYAICKDCREKWNIALRQDTRGRYLCPRCKRRKKHRKRKGRKSVQLFEHIFLCDMGRYKECFRYNEFLGNEAGRKVQIQGL